MKKLHFFFIWLKRPYHFAQGFLAHLLFGLFRRPLHIITVTGTDGKTTTSTMIYHILKSAGKRVALISTVAAYIGDQSLETGLHVTSPGPFSLQRLLNKMSKQGYDYVVLEITSHAIHQYRMFGIKSEITALTNITHDHLDYHRTYENYLKVKVSLFARAKVAVIHKADKSYKQVKDMLHRSEARVVEYDFRHADTTIKNGLIKAFAEPYNRENALAAITVCMQLHVGVDRCLQAIAKFPGVPGRLENVPNTTGIRVVVDFATTPNAMQSVLGALKAQLKKGQRLIVVHGCAGHRDQAKRPTIGRIISEIADVAIFTADDPRTEDVNSIIRQMKEGITQNWGHIHEIPDRRTAIEYAIQKIAQPGDIVALVGKGHEKSLAIGKKELPWSDKEEALKALEGRKKGNI